MPESYTEEQVQQILQRALARKSKHGDLLSRQQVSEIASELGVSEADFLAAEQEWMAQKSKSQERADFDIYKRKEFRDGLLKYFIVNAFLIGINLFTSGHVSWAAYPFLIWGLGIALKAYATFQADSEAYETEFNKWQLKQKRDRITAQITNKVASSVENWLKSN
ncbi:2TM domain-containing protein [Tumidithrix helvetica PCC 7403]|uniref:2TM domain-containing protein n=1 Tax=Tumidithrix helvetica TaxID=3457545 RepID=UPI003C80CF82